MHMTIKELQSKNVAELQKDLATLRIEQRDLRFKAASQELKNTRQIQVVRKDIARIMTLLGQRADAAIVEDAK
jgi:large subunit ribosomal protein L29